MNRTLLAATIAGAALLAAGCKKPTETTAPSATVSATAAPAPVAPASTGTPTEEDFEQQALDDINPQNMEQELEKLEKEIEH